MRCNDVRCDDVRCGDVRCDDVRCDDQKEGPVGTILFSLGLGRTQPLLGGVHKTGIWTKPSRPFVPPPYPPHFSRSTGRQVEQKASSKIPQSCTSYQTLIVNLKDGEKCFGELWDDSILTEFQTNPEATEERRSADTNEFGWKLI